MSPAELLVECPTCHRTHPVNAGCDHGDESPGCVVAAPVEPRVTTFAPPPSAIAWWVERAQVAEYAAEEARHQLGVVIAERDEVVAVLREYYTADTAERLRAAKEAVRETLDRFPRKED